MKFELFKQILAIFTLSVLFGFLIILFLHKPSEIERADFKNYYTGAKIILSEDRKSLYNIETQSKYQQPLTSYSHILLPFRSLPPLALFFTPLTIFDFPIAFKVFTISMVLSIFMLAIYYRKQLSTKYYVPILAAFFYPNYSSILQGQIVVIFAIILFFIYWLIKQKKFYHSGLLTGVLFLRPQYLLIIPLLLLIIDKKKSFIRGLVLSSIVLLLTSFLLVGSQSMISYPQFILSTEISEFGSSINSMPGVIYLVDWVFQTVDGDTSTTSLLFINYLLFLLFFYLIKQKIYKTNLATKFSISILLFVPFMGHVYMHDMVLFQIPLFLLIDQMFSPLIIILYMLILLEINYLIPVFMLLTIIYYLRNSSTLSNE